MTESFFTKCEKDYLKLLNAKKSKMEINDEDLECAWDCFETARLYFEKLGRADYLAKIHKYSADILSFNNDFATAVIEYEKALDYCGSDFAKCAILEDMADCYGNMKNKKKVQEIEKTIEDIQLI
ncbi:hypothetical protein ECANGB1_1974 [Enterospora canceri]|nr:hypothetical protein ECANGB1_1974 [Enterospora canceri]